MADKQNGKPICLVADLSGGIPLGATVGVANYNPQNQPGIVTVQPVAVLPPQSTKPVSSAIGSSSSSAKTK